MCASLETMQASEDAASGSCPSPRVVIEHRADEWVVEVFESGVLHERDFVLEAYAASYADGQRIRLGLRLASPRTASDIADDSPGVG
jgi:hypothetical protein